MPNADLEVVSVWLNGPVSATVGVPFFVTGQTEIRNNAASTAVLVDTTFTPSLPPECTATTGVITVQDTPIPVDSSVFLSRSWMVTCATPGLKTIALSVSTALDSSVPASDDNPANNSGSASRDVQVN